MQIEYSPIASLNRTYTLSKVKGKAEAISESEKLNLAKNQFYFTLLAELYTGIDNGKAKQHFQKAITLQKTQADRKIVQRKIDKF